MLYEDTNGDKKLDDNDKLIGELEETDSGVHEMTGLLAKGFFVKEQTAPESFMLDPNAYYFEITEDGQVVVVENGEAGYGFVNEAYRGNLKIVKDSSDGRKDGFAFEVRSADGTYCETFTSPSSGVIEIKGLRIGKYTVTEVKNKASEDYIIRTALLSKSRRMKQPSYSSLTKSRKILIRRKRQAHRKSRFRRQAMTTTFISGLVRWALL